MSEWSSVIAAVTPILTGAVGMGVGLLVGTLKRDELKRQLDTSLKVAHSRLETITSLDRSRAGMREELIELQTRALNTQKANRDRHIRALGMLVTAFGLKPSDLKDYAATVDCAQARAWKPADAKPATESVPMMRPGETFDDYFERVNKWLERQTTPPSK